MINLVAKFLGSAQTIEFKKEENLKIVYWYWNVYLNVFLKLQDDKLFFGDDLNDNESYDKEEGVGSSKLSNSQSSDGSNKEGEGDLASVINDIFQVKKKKSKESYYH